MFFSPETRFNPKSDSSGSSPLDLRPPHVFEQISCRVHKLVLEVSRRFREWARRDSCTTSVENGTRLMQVVGGQARGDSSFSVLDSPTAIKCGRWEPNHNHIDIIGENSFPGRPRSNYRP